MGDRTSPEKLKLVIVNPKSKVSYRRGCFLGKGGFSSCYEFKNTTTKETFAGKVVSKSMLMKPHAKEKMFQEIQIHSALSHRHVVTLHSYFEDESNMYIILELCRKRSLMEMLKRRKTLTVPEVRYFMKQVVQACKYMHDTKVTHQDLKLANLFISDDMEIKVGDFGFATRLTPEGKRTLCGTPNYVVPDIFTKQGNSHKVDIWSLGCIMYTLLVGNSPFETSTYAKISHPRLDESARQLIRKLLHSDPDQRPNADQILVDDFLCDYIPSRLPTSCLTMQPRFSNHMSIWEVSRHVGLAPFAETLNIPIPEKATAGMAAGKFEDVVENRSSMSKDFYLKDLRQMLEKVILCQPEAKYSGQFEYAQDPSAVPFVWISKWVDYTDRCGFGYLLNDNSIGVFFNDTTHLVLLQDRENLKYIPRNNAEQYYTIENPPTWLSRKITLLNFIHTSMTINLRRADETAEPRDNDRLANAPYLRAWFRTKSATIFHLSNGTLQVNFFKDDSKIILCPLIGAISFIYEDSPFFTVYSLQLIRKYGCSPMVASRLRYAKGIVEKLYKDFLNSEKAANDVRAEW